MLLAGLVVRFSHFIVVACSGADSTSESVGNESGYVLLACRYQARASLFAGDASLRTAVSKVTIWAILRTSRSSPKEGIHFIPRQMRPEL